MSASGPSGPLVYSYPYYAEPACIRYSDGAMVLFYCIWILFKGTIIIENEH